MPQEVKISSNIKERILQYAKYKGVSFEKFFSELGLTYGNFKGQSKNSALSSDAIEKILTMYPEINVEWLVTGKGIMTRNYDGNVSYPTVNEPTNGSSYSSEKDRTIAILEREVEDLRSDKLFLQRLIDSKLL